MTYVTFALTQVGVPGSRVNVEPSALKLFTKEVITQGWQRVKRVTPDQGRIELPKAVRGHATSYSACIDGIVLSVTKNNVSG